MAVTIGTILIVDDIPTNLSVLMQLLGTTGYKVLVATDGESAVQQAEYALPDMILLDVMMPGIDGFETCRRLKASQITQDIPVIFMTALSDTVDKVYGFQLGAVDYVTKPLQHEEVIARVNTHLTLHRQKQEIERLRQQERLHYEQLSQLKDQMLHTASHDLKNPLQVITTAVDLMRRYNPSLDERTKEKLSQIETSAAYMRDLITNLLDLARIETGIDLRRQKVLVKQLLEINITQAALLAQEKGIVLQYSQLENGTTVYCDPRLIGQVFQNLISNAVKYTISGGAIEVGTKIGETEVNFHVMDHGLGIPEKDIPHIFDKFFRVNTPEHRSVSGTGLGLSIVREIIQQHGGSVHVESRVGVGTTISFSLPQS
jgi:two-component system, sensor histidine kinase and response regulator